MSTLVTVCGFCASRDQTFDVVSSELRNGDREFILGIRCRKCRKISCITATSGNAYGVRDALGKNGDVTDGLQIRERVPLMVEPTAPEHVPPEVARAYIQAQKLVGSPDMAEPAAVMYGRTVETALAELARLRSVSLAGATLVKRIDDAASQGLLPNDLAEWAHEVRHLRNEGAHGTAVNHTEVVELQGFVELLLRYLFTLPGIMTERRLKKSAASEPEA